MLLVSVKIKRCSKEENHRLRLRRNLMAAEQSLTVHVGEKLRASTDGHVKAVSQHEFSCLFKWIDSFGWQNLSQALCHRFGQWFTDISASCKKKSPGANSRVRIADRNVYAVVTVNFTSMLCICHCSVIELIFAP